MWLSAGAFSLSVLLFLPHSALGYEWQDYYQSCVTLSANEEACYADIAEFLESEEGRAQAAEVHFKRHTTKSSVEERAQAVVVVQRLEQMQTNLRASIRRSENEPLLNLCLSDRANQLDALINAAREVRNQMLARPEEPATEGTQKLRALSQQSDQIYRLAQACGK